LVCSECYDNEITLWRELPMNETIRTYVRTYTPPPKVFHLSLIEALDEWSGSEEAKTE
jgi:uncharacterized OB-fold protein